MIEPKVVYEDKDFLVLMKPAGLLTHPFHVGTDKGKTVIKEPTLTDWLKSHYPEAKKVGDNPAMRPGLVHRLDRETSGLLIIARNQKTFEYFKTLFQTGGIRKTYLALVKGVPKNQFGRIEKSISLKPGTTKRTVYGGKMTKSATTEYKILETFNKQGRTYALLEVHPLTGRTHQIRVHLASIGHPIVGDKVYGYKEERGMPGTTSRLMLHALALSFEAAGNKHLEIKGSIPQDFAKSIADLHPKSKQS